MNFSMDGRSPTATTLLKKLRKELSKEKVKYCECCLEGNVILLKVDCFSVNKHHQIPAFINGFFFFLNVV